MKKSFIEKKFKTGKSNIYFEFECVWLNKKNEIFILFIRMKNS